MPNRLHIAIRSGLAALALALPATGCRDSAPDDLIQQEPTTEALVFVKTEGEETLNRSWANGNLYRLSPIAPDGVVTPITQFTGASVSDPVVSFDGQRILFSMRPAGATHRNLWEIRTDGSGLVLLNDATEPGVHILAKATGSSLRLAEKNGRERLVTP